MWNLCAYFLPEVFNRLRVLGRSSLAETSVYEGQSVCLLPLKSLEPSKLLCNLPP